MKKIIKYPCPKCKHLRDGTILIFQVVSENCTVVRFKMDCCNIELVKFFTQLDIKHYIKEV